MSKQCVEYIFSQQKYKIQIPDSRLKLLTALGSRKVYATAVMTTENGGKWRCKKKEGDHFCIHNLSGFQTYSSQDPK